MKRVGGLWDELVSFPNLLLAARRATAGKRSRPDVAAFLLDLEPQLIRLRRELQDGSYHPGPYRSFRILEPKPRRISAAPFRDRVVHHALTQVVEPIFERRFSKDSFACRKGFGTHRAIGRAREGAQRFRYVLKCDVRKYFPSIDHEILKSLLARGIKCRRTLGLAAVIIDGSNLQEAVLAYYAGDELFTPHERRRGLPLGNQTSQFFANVYLNPVDQMMSREMRAALYVRYVDDILVFGDDKKELRRMRQRIEAALGKVRLSLHPGKSRTYPTARGFGFLGWRILPEHSRLARGNVVRFRRRMRGLQQDYADGAVGWDEIRPRVRAWIAHASHGDTWRLRGEILGGRRFEDGVRSHEAGFARRVLEQQCREPSRVEP